MKRTLALFLLLSTLLPLASCSQAISEPAPATEVQTEEKTKETAEVHTWSVPTPLTWEQINAIPVANSSMTSDELRKICVDFFRLQASFQWTPEKNFEYTIRSSDSVRKFQAGKYYGGIPYVTSSKGGGNLSLDGALR